MDECLEKFDKDADYLNSQMKDEIFLSADAMLVYRRKYAYNMFDKMTPSLERQATELQIKNEKFFEDYRYYENLVNLREKWTFLQAALTTVYFPAKKDISLDKVLTFLEYRHVSDFQPNKSRSDRFSLLGSCLGKLSRSFINHRRIER